MSRDSRKTRRPLVDYSHLTKRQQSNVDSSGGEYFTYRGCAYSLDDFMRLGYPGENPDPYWHGYFAESAFSAILVHLTADGYDVVCCRRLC